VSHCYVAMSSGYTPRRYLVCYHVWGPLSTEKGPGPGNRKRHRGPWPGAPGDDRTGYNRPNRTGHKGLRPGDRGPRPYVNPLTR
jgi:hypothetical protein